MSINARQRSLWKLINEIYEMGIYQSASYNLTEWALVHFIDHLQLQRFQIKMSSVK